MTVEMTPLEAVNEALSLVGHDSYFTDSSKWDEQLGELLAMIYSHRWREALQRCTAFIARDPRAADMLVLTGYGRHPLVALHITHIAMAITQSPQGEQ